MNYALPSPRPWPMWQTLARVLAGLLVALLLAWTMRPAHAAPPPAGTSISNQASATYSDGSGVARTVTSNLVQTTVSQVYSLTLTANGAQNATPGSIVYYPHTLTNTGNGSDTFNLTAVNVGGSAFTMSNIQIYADNGSGQPTGSPITSSGAIPANGTFRFIVQGTVPTSATPPNQNALTVTATSTGTGTPSASNTDTTTVTSNAVVTLTKAVSATSGPVDSGPYTYTLTYTNTGNSNATAVAINDAIPAGMRYVPGSARWSVTGTTALSDSGGSSGAGANTLTSTVSGPANGPNVFTATIATVTPGQSGFLTFQVRVNPGVAPGVLNNTATVAYNNGAGNVNGSSNVVPFTVTQSAAVTLTGQTVAGPVAAGSTVSFTNVLTNTGNGTDTFNVTLAAPGSNAFPAGTTFQLFRSDGTTPMVDTNGDGIEDTGPLAPNAVYNIVVRATLPPTVSGGPFSVLKTARSVLDSNVSATAADTVSAVTGASVDLTNTTATGSGLGTGPEGSQVLAQAVNPGASTTFTLVVSNKGLAPDSYNLSASRLADFSTGLPTGWTVTFRTDGGDNTCAAPGGSITNTGTIAGGASATVCAVVSVPAGYVAGNSSVFFRALSPTSAASDRLHDGVNVNAVRLVSLTPNGTGQTYPGGSFIYSHTLTNNGNVDEGSGLSTLALALADSTSGWTSTVYIDNGTTPGVLDAGDTLVTGSLNAVLASGLLPRGQSVTLFNRVIAPSGALPGSVNATTITVTTANGTHTATAPVPTVATDSTTVIAGNLTLVKTQALDADCNGVADGGTFSQATFEVRPNQCVLYQVTVTNVGAANATNVVVSDATPAFTTISTAPSTIAPHFASGPAAGASGTVHGYIGDGATASTGGTLAPGASAVITFGVRITP